ncbi:PREDICTED: putative small intestine sodium-dependent phosphate transport protein-like [Elephantulus edwardii]|uniref:putative small intestine sodium-dependent phosphate transport protein-like n=1 Tax=Elephantulus edwardii TaxID=28737 RepID=UPI0003F06F2F|nr:PREDICTED: putative small intestine sodium-dependent phosphate transport protein-like [Elephantulus edwardii]
MTWANNKFFFIFTLQFVYIVGIPLTIILLITTFVKTSFCTTRHGLAFILLICNFISATQMTCLNIAMPAMVNHTASPNPPNNSTDSQDYSNVTLEEFQAVAPVYEWSAEIQGLILGSTNYVSFLIPIPIGYVTGVFGSKKVVGAGLLLSSVMTLFIPLAADTGATLLIVIRAIQGIAQTMIMTGQFSIWVKWAPPVERSQLTNIAMSGVSLGIFIVYTVGGFICETIGWPYVFYIFGAVGSVSCLLSFSLVYNNPMSHPFISTDEKTYITCALGQQNSSPNWSLPIMDMTKSLPLWAILVSYFCEYWSLYVMTLYTPTYLNSALQANLKNSGVLSALPAVFAFISTILEGLLADFLISRKIFKVITVRKLFTSIGVLISSSLLMSLHWVKSSPSTSVAILVVRASINNFSNSGSLVNFMDIAPRYTSFLKGLSEVFSSAAGIGSSITTGFILQKDSKLGWRNVFFLSAAIKVFGLIIYLIFGKAEVQDWAKEKTATTTEIENQAKELQVTRL